MEENKQVSDPYERLNVNPTLGFDPAPFGVNPSEGLVDGRKIGILAATLCAISRHTSWKERQEQLGGVA
jgi:hypothetical protein